MNGDIGTVVVAITTSALGIAGTLAATFITLRHQRRLAATDRADAHRRELRDVLVPLATVASSWSSAEEVFLMTLVSSANKREADKFAFEWVDTDSGTQMRHDALELRALVTRASLIANDAQMLELIEIVRGYADGRSNPMVPILHAFSQNPTARPSIDLLGAALASVRVFRDAVGAIEKRAAELVRPT